MKTNLIQDKAFAFSKKIISVYKSLIKDKKEFILSKQLLRSGTSIGANVEEALGSQSKKQFIAKLFIAYREARECRYWIEILFKGEYLESQTHSILSQSIEEICRILGKILKTSRTKNK